MSLSDPPEGDNIIDDELLSAWVDGELGAEDGARVQAWLRAHPEDRARVQAWAADRAALAAALGGAVQEPVPESLQALLRHREGPPRWAVAASAAGLLVLGALLGGATVWHWQSQQSAQALAELQQRLAPGSAEGWVQRAALAHGVYVAEPRHAVEVRAEEEHLARWLTRRIDIPVKLFDLREQGFALVGGRLLPDGPGKSAQLMYQDAQQRRVTVYLRKPESGTDAAFRYEQHGALGMFYWVEEGAGYALVGDLPKPVLLALARSIYQQHPGVGAGAAPAVPAAPAAPAPADPAASVSSRS
jgi:anti-sigma factor RsiW